MNEFKLSDPDIVNYQKLIQLDSEIWECITCPLHATRQCAVPGAGYPDPKLMFIGEAPGANEDREGYPFAGRAGKLLNEALENAGLFREEIFITNILKCHPPKNRNPTNEEMNACLHFLQEQIDILKPELIVTLGKVAAEFLLKRKVFITKENGCFDFFNNTIMVMTVLHPAYILRNRKKEINDSFFQAIQTAKEIIYPSNKFTHLIRM